MKTLQQLLAFLITGMIILSCGKTDNSSTGKEVQVPKRPLNEVTFYGNLEAVEQHIAYGSDLNQKDDYGSTSLNTAITFDHPEIAIALIEAGADLTITTADGSTPLHTAAFLGRVDVVQVLIEKGAALDQANNYGSTPYESVSAPFDQVKMVYDQLSRDLGPFGFKLDYEKLKTNREAVAQILQEALQSQNQ